MKSIAKKAAKFTFIGLPKRLIGWDQLKANNRLIADLWRSVRTPADTSTQAAKVRERFAQLRADERQHLIAGHVRVSRFWFGCAGRGRTVHGRQPRPFDGGFELARLCPACRCVWP